MTDTDRDTLMRMVAFEHVRRLGEVRPSDRRRTETGFRFRGRAHPNRFASWPFFRNASASPFRSCSLRSTPTWPRSVTRNR